MGRQLHGRLGDGERVAVTGKERYAEIHRRLGDGEKVAMTGKERDAEICVSGRSESIQVR